MTTPLSPMPKDLFIAACPVQGCIYKSPPSESERGARSDLNEHLQDGHEAHFWRNLLSDHSPTVTRYRANGQ